MKKRNEKVKKKKKENVRTLERPLEAVRGKIPIYSLPRITFERLTSNDSSGVAERTRGT